jgi:hypothetical protein
MSKKSPHDILADLLEKASELDDDELVEHFEQLQNSGTTVVVQTEEEEPEFYEGASPYTEVVQYCKLEIDGEIVQEWDSTYWGHPGGSGSEWWIERGDSSIDFDVENLLQILDLMPATPDVPKPEISDGG